MKKAIISTVAIALFALPMSLQAGPTKMEDTKPQSANPFSTMKSTMESPSKSDPSSKNQDPAIKPSGKAHTMEEKDKTAHKMLEEAEMIGKKKAADTKK